MGSYTTGRYGLYKPDGSELVDPSVLEANWAKLDDKMYNDIRWHVDASDNVIPDSSQLPSDGKYWKFYHVKSGQIYVVPYKSGPSTVVQKVNNQNPWNNFTLLAGFSAFTSGSMDRPAWRYRNAAQTLVEFKGRVALTNATRNSTISMIASGQCPGVSGIPRFFAVPSFESIANPDANDYLRVGVDTAGAVTYVRYGQASLTDRFIDLNNVKYGTT